MSAGSVLRLLLAALMALALTACGSAPGGGGPTSFERADAAKFVLGPRDLGRGYMISSDSGCGGFSPESHSERFMTFVFETRPTGCRNYMNYIWGGPRTTVVPRSVQSRVAIFDGEADARQAMEMRGELLRFMVGLTPQEFTDLESFGHDAVLFRSDGYDLPPQAGVLWRNGNMLALVYAGGEGMSAEQASKAAPELARKQQDRIERPRPAEPRPKKDPELPLDDPTLSVPVYWLGRTFSPGGGLPTLSFARSYAGAGVPELGFTVEVDYDTESRQTEGVKLWVFHPDAFDRFEKGILGRLVTAASCSSPTKREIPGGHVVIWSGYAKPTRGTCPTGSYDRYVGYIHLRDAVVTVNQPWCLYPCGAPFHAAPYQSVDGVMAIARGLQVRKPR